MHYDDQDVVVKYTFIKKIWRVLRVRGLRVLYGIPSNSSSIVFYGDCHSYSSKYVYLQN